MISNPKESPLLPVDRSVTPHLSVSSYNDENCKKKKSFESDGQKWLTRHSLCALDKKFAELATELIIQNLNTHITIKRLAAKVGTNQCRLKVAFKSYHNATIGEYSLRARMEQSQKMLLHQKKKIAEVCLLVGYSNVSNFTNAFKRYYKITPGKMVKSGVMIS